ncbi:MAG: hypothetical protein KCCBMMGE_00288 [Candidatus Methanoperedenaceae archaeon GB37]|nr:MAG: hypothetical protein KCCBMMGE_00288 [Candidatus Methanoperedenaceae archaeon GB37]
MKELTELELTDLWKEGGICPATTCYSLLRFLKKGCTTFS